MQPLAPLALPCAIGYRQPMQPNRIPEQIPYWAFFFGLPQIVSGVGMEEDRLRRIGPSHFSRINFRGTFQFNVERYTDMLVVRAAGNGVRRSSQ